MSFLTKKRVLIIKAESVPGTAETITAADYNIRFEEPKFTPKIEFDATKKVVTPDYGEYEDVPGMQAGEITTSFKLCPGTDTNVPANIDKAFKMAGLIGQAVGSVGYKWLDKPEGDEQTYTALIMDVTSGGTPTGWKQLLVGCMCDIDIEAAGLGKPLIATLKLSGKLGSLTDLNNANMISLGTMTSCDETPAYIFQNATCGGGSFSTFKCSKFKLSGGRTIQPLINSGDGTGIEYYSIVDRKPHLSLNPLKTAKATFDAIAQAEAMGISTMCTITISGPTYPLYFKFPNPQILNPKEVEREGRIAWDLDFKLRRNGYDGNLKLSSESVSTLFLIAQNQSEE